MAALAPPLAVGDSPAGGRMGDADALLWRMGADPVLRPTVVAVAVVVGTPDWGRLEARVGELVAAEPRLRSRVDPLPLGLWRPRFVPERQFDLRSHLVHLAAPAPAQVRQVLDLAELFATEPFDPSRPLWRALLVEGVVPERAALVVKLHHALADGLGALALLARLFAGCEPAPLALVGSDDRSGAPAPGGPLRCLRAVPSALVGAVGALPGLLGRSVTAASSVPALAAPAIGPLSTVMTGRGPRRHFEVLDLDRRDLVAAAVAAGATVNDAFLAATALGMRRYHERHGAAPEALRVLMPVSIRRPQDRAASNRFVPVRFVLPLPGTAGDALQTVSGRARRAKRAEGLAVADVMAGGLDLLPPPLARGVWRSLLMGVDYCATDLSGPAEPVFVAGAPLEHLYAFAPPSGAACNISLVTLGTRACVGLNIDTAAVDDPPVLRDCLYRAFDEVVKGAPVKAGTGDTAASAPSGAPGP